MYRISCSGMRGSARRNPYAHAVPHAGGYGYTHANANAQPRTRAECGTYGCRVDDKAAG